MDRGQRAIQQLADTPASGWHSDPLWFKDAVVYEVHVRAFCDSNDDGIGDFAGLTQQARLHPGPGRQHHLAAALLSLAAARRRLRHRRLSQRASRSTARAQDFRAFVREAHRRGLRGDHRAGDQPHLRPASLVPGRARARRPARPSATTTCGATTPRKYSGTRIIFTDTETLQLDLGRGGQGLLLAPLLQPPARPELRQPAGAQGGRSAPCASGSTWAWTACGWMPSPTWCEREGTNNENLPRDPRGDEADPAGHRRALRRPHAAGRGQPVAGGRARLFRRRRRMPHGLPLPADAAHVHGDRPGGPPSRSSRSCSRRPTSPTTASGRSSCATTTSSRWRW